MIIAHFVFRRRWLNNLHFCHVEYQGVVYKSVEHAYQAIKAAHPVDKRWIMEADSAREARMRGEHVRLRGGWNPAVARRLMLKLLWSKFHHNPALREKLLKTWPHELVHGNMEEDRYWGVSRRTGDGENHLGKLLMFLRDMVREGTDRRIPDMGRKKLERHKRYRQRVRERIEDHNLGIVVRPLPKLSGEEQARYSPSNVKRKQEQMGVAAQSRRAKATWPARKWDEEFYRKMRLEMFGPQRRLDPHRFKQRGEDD